MKTITPVKDTYKDGSEHEHIKMLNHFRTRISHEIFRKTPAEREELKTAQAKHPTDKHKPDNRHVTFTREGD